MSMARANSAAMPSFAPVRVLCVQRHLRLWLLLVLAVVVLDQWTKSWASAHLVYGWPREILPVFNLTLQHNRGAAFSFLSDAAGWQRWFFTVIALLVSALLLLWMARLRAEQRLLLASLALIVGGALGNVWDRLLLGYVVDFISLHYQQYYFPAFNLADTAISVGAFLMIVDMLKNPQHHR